MKKVYSKPLVEITHMMSISTICFSAGFGGTTGDIHTGGSDPIPGD